MGTHPIFESDFDCLTDGNGGSQGTPQEADLGEEAKAKSSSAKLDPLPYWQHHQVQRQETPLAPYQDWFVNYSNQSQTSLWTENDDAVHFNCAFDSFVIQSHMELVF